MHVILAGVVAQLWLSKKMHLRTPLAFGSPVAQRFGSLRFMAFMAMTAAVGAAVHLVTHFGELPLVSGPQLSE
jgi:membrane associated rhomboid family serine protease